MWLLDGWRQAYGAKQTAQIEAVLRQTPPLDLQFRNAIALKDWQAANPGMGHALTPTCLRLEATGDVTRLPGFDAGMWWVQDISAALAAPLLRADAQTHVLDLCAAPGGKTLQLAASGARVTALDASQSRLERLRANLARTGLSAQALRADLENWEAPEDFPACCWTPPARPPAQFAATPICLCTAAAVTLKKAHACSPPFSSGRLTQQPPAVR